MPIRPENRGRYPTDWPNISRAIRHRAEDRCECDGRCGRRACTGPRCIAVNGEPSPWTGATVVLTCAHLDHTPENCDPANLMAMCQACHLAYDADHHRATRERTRAEARAAAGQGSLLDEEA